MCPSSPKKIKQTDCVKDEMMVKVDLARSGQGHDATCQSQATAQPVWCAVEAR